MTPTSKQTLNFFEEESHSKYRKAARAELRALRDAFPLKTDDSIGEPFHHKLKREVQLRPVKAFCTAEEINLKYLSKFLRQHKMFTKTVGYYGECIYARVSLDREEILRTTEAKHFDEDSKEYSDEHRKDISNEEYSDGHHKDISNEEYSDEHRKDISNEEYSDGHRKDIFNEEYPHDTANIDLLDPKLIEKYRTLNATSEPDESRGTNKTIPNRFGSSRSQSNVNQLNRNRSNRPQLNSARSNKPQQKSNSGSYQAHRSSPGNAPSRPDFSQKTQCAHTTASSSSAFDVFFFEFGVTVFWGASSSMENKVLRLIKVAEVNSYQPSQIEVESFSYGITNEALFCNDIIYLNSDYFFYKMVISCAIAQSVKLDYFEEATDGDIDEIKHLPEEVGNVGRTNYTRTDILKFIGRLHKLRINLNLVTNILDEPELLWNFPKYSELYESFRHCLEIKTRADILNQRCDVIHGILEILSENINTRNSERLEKMIIGLIAVSVAVGIVQIIVLIYKR